MTIREVQELVAAWDEKSSASPLGELTAMAVLTGQVGELARVIAARHGQTAGSDAEKALADGLSDVMWALFALAGQSHIDLTEALIDNLSKRNAPAPSGGR